jgi:hypothetical protein
MAIYTQYATLTDLADYLCVTEQCLPLDSQRLLSRASELIKQVTLNNIVETNEKHMEAAKLATCAQVEYWQSMGETSAMSGNVKSFSIGNFSAEYDTGGSTTSGNPSQVAIRAKNYLNQQGLLYRGVRMNASTDVLTNSD